jgi:hypothetical protein
MTLTSPPPTTSTFLPLICQAMIRLPPPCTSGNFVAASAMLVLASKYGSLSAVREEKQVPVHGGWENLRLRGEAAF